MHCGARGVTRMHAFSDRSGLFKTNSATYSKDSGSFVASLIVAWSLGGPLCYVSLTKGKLRNGEVDYTFCVNKLGNCRCSNWSQRLLLLYDYYYYYYYYYYYSKRPKVQDVKNWE